MEFSQPQRRDRVRGLTRGLGGIKNLNCLGGREAHKEDLRTYEQIEHRTHLLAPILSRKEAFGSPRGPHQNFASPILSKKLRECRQNWRRMQ
jgi:hypothetical protein